MLHRESIAIEDYTDEFGVPYLAEFADTFRKYVVKSGVRNCFCLDMPLYLPGQRRPLPILLKRKGDGSFECSAGDLRINYAGDSAALNLKDEILKGFEITREWDDEIGEVYFYGLHVGAKIFCQLDMDFSFQKLVTGVCRISDNGGLLPRISSNASILSLCDTYEVEYDGQNFEVTLPNIDTKYSIRRFFNYLQFVCAIEKNR